MIDFRFIAAVLCSGIYGVGVSLLVRKLRHDVSLEARSAILVVVGVGGTVIISGIVIGWMAAAAVVCMFIASGAPMIAEEYSWSIRRDAQQLKNLRGGENGTTKETTNGGFLGLPGCVDSDEESDWSA